ncbi:hypothetical protein [Natrarchaeobius oligotrophus]|uniref:Class I SAM-dependent methyltransferase n=1 Tax=Natrarchaeobius chitinivorans TaxID=1679083 RepID=A0A3N6MII1_NATCH|nr:hypothetical protein [Natrarchaeobius chitinivorans]RQH00975.1 hypothetical protein EA472_10180 [Natrarchaeobius chitinivorans]
MQANFHTDTARLITDIRYEFDVDRFIETGTNVGETAEWASEYFDRVTTIEMDDELHARATNERGHLDNIEFVKGKSQDELPKIVQELEDSAVFHLDAHCGGKWLESAGDTSANAEFTECPVLEELEALSLSDHDHFVFIDDARVFTSPRREPFDMDDWPGIQEIIHAVEEVNEDYHVLIYVDEIIVVPPFATEFVRERIRTYKTENRDKSNRFKRYVMNKVWQHASLSGPVQDV